MTTSPTPQADATDVREALRKLYQAYVNLLESGHDRITSLGGTCDLVEVMEAGDPALVAARAALAQDDSPATLRHAASHLCAYPWDDPSADRSDLNARILALRAVLEGSKPVEDEDRQL